MTPVMKFMLQFVGVMDQPMIMIVMQKMQASPNGLKASAIEKYKIYNVS